MTNHEVVIAGGGPTGLMLAGELALARVDVAIVERRMNQELAGSRAGGLLSRTIEVLDQRGIAERFLSEGKVSPVGAFFASIALDISDFPTRHNYLLGLWQKHIERILAAWVDELAVPIYRGRDVTGFAQDDHGVDVELSSGDPVRARYLVGCDGGRSVIRKVAGIEFPGWDASVSYLIAEAAMTGEPAFGLRHGDKGVHGLGKLDDGRVRAVLSEPEVRNGDTPTIDELRAALVAVYGTDYGVHDVTWLSRFSDATRQAASYRAGRVLLAGDAAHVHSPTGGQGLNLGVQDAVNLGWKLAQVVHGTSSDRLLDSYHAERHPIGARALEATMAQTALSRGDARTMALRDTLGELIKLDEPRKHYAGMMSGLDIHYDLGAGHPLLGRRMPDLDVVTDDGPRRVFTLLHEAKPVLLELGDALDITPWAARVRHVRARYAGEWELPVLGKVAPANSVLIRPDGYVAWVGDGTDNGLRDALVTWFGLADDRPIER